MEIEYEGMGVWERRAVSLYGIGQAKHVETAPLRGLVPKATGGVEILDCALRILDYALVETNPKSTMRTPSDLACGSVTLKGGVLAFTKLKQ
jgi:hypothetical protein